MPHLNAYAIKKPAFVLGIEDLFRVQTDPKMRLTASPFTHNAENTVFLGRGVTWKGTGHPAGVKGMTKEFLAAAPTKVIDGLKEAIRISQECKGIRGTVLVGDRILPKKVVCEIGKKKNVAG